MAHGFDSAEPFLRSMFSSAEIKSGYSVLVAGLTRGVLTRFLLQSGLCWYVPGVSGARGQLMQMARSVPARRFHQRMAWLTQSVRVRH